MQLFKDSAGSEYAFDDDVIVTKSAAGAYSFSTVNGKPLNVPGTLTPYSPPAPTAADLLKADKDAKVIALYASCQAEILGGFVSTALGSAYSYPSKFVDQQNLSASVLDSVVDGTASGWTTDFWCADNSTPPVWARRAHTAVQIQQVGKDCKAFISAAQTKLDGLVQQVNAAADQATIDAIVW